MKRPGSCIWSLKGKTNWDKVIQVREPHDHPLAEVARREVLERFAGTALSGKYIPKPPVRGPFGAASIMLMEGAVPVSKPTFRIGRERREIQKRLVQEIVAADKVETGAGAWNLPSFLVPKKELGKFRMVQDFRPLNEVTVKDGHPLPRINDILLRQGQCRIWSKLDLVDGYHQMPIREEDRPKTCMSSPIGTVQWKVLSMGLKNAGSQFQRMMEWVLQDCAEFATAYLFIYLFGPRDD